ncbi:MAG TPA: asparagine synthase (glutamine-hydrolyzing) [Solirubrobacteraceae bacterium]|nr:asparagine synthase (glutamine-hydrolyzing) [Solirubrobacteraceae bacterium]
MCGIAGFLSTDGQVGGTVADEQLRVLRHRGPDAVGRFASARACVGQARLAVIDLETGDPPITNEDGTIAVALNGELYNFRALREELHAAGHALRTKGDTEVLAHLAETDEPVELARRLDGMFALAIWDETRGRLILARDRVGKKPLYYSAAPAAFVFASEIKGVLAHPGVARELDDRAIPAYLTFGYVPTPHTFFRGVSSVPPAHVLVVEPGGEPRLERYWSPPRPRAAGEVPGDLRSAGRAVRTALAGAVERRLIADVPLGAFLSGGIDSSAIVAIMAADLGRPVQTFSIGFEDRQGFDERPYARLVAQRYATDHHEFVVAPDAVGLVERLLWHHDQPFGDSSAIPTYLLNEVTRSHLTVALSGDGGDELFGGYERFAAGLALGDYQRVPRLVRRLTRAALMRLPPTALRGRAGSLQRFAAAGVDLDLIGAYRAWLAFVDEPTRRALLREPDDWALRDYERIWRESDGSPVLDRLLDLNLRTYLVDDLLVKADRMSMAHGLEVRSPFLDRQLIELAADLPPELKVRRLALKRVLKEAVRDLLPAEVLDRPKRGFGVPLDRWFREDLRGYLHSMLRAPSARVREHLAQEPLDGLLNEHDRGLRNHGNALWTLLCLEAFLRREGW